MSRRFGSDAPASVAIHLLVAVLTAAGCSTAAQPAGQPPATSPPPSSAAAAPVPVAALEGLLLAPDELNQLLRTVQLSAEKTQTTMVDGDVAEPQCASAWRNAWQSAYEGSGWLAVRNQYLGNGDHPEVLGDNMENKVFQSVVSFPLAVDANAFYAKQATAWKACNGRKVDEHDKGDPPTPHDLWVLGEANDHDGLLTMPASDDNSDNGWSCQRALTIRNNVAVDVLACRSHPTDQGEAVASAIAAKVPVK